MKFEERLGGSVVECLPLAQGMILRSWDGVSYLPCRKPDKRFDPRTSGSCPEPKADAKPLNHPGVPKKSFLHSILLVFLRLFSYS